MFRRPPRSTLFPTRRSSDLRAGGRRAGARPPRGSRRECPTDRPTGRSRDGRAARSEEHTSELQSPYDLVCRLLLEKKKKKEDKYDDEQLTIWHRATLYSL